MSGFIMQIRFSRFLSILVCLSLVGPFADRATADPIIKLHSNRADVAPLENVPLIEVGPIDLLAVQAEDLVNEQNGQPTRIAIPFPVAITPANDGLWETLSDGSSLWRIRLAADDARHINLGFIEYDMPERGELVLFARDQSEIVRPFTAADVQDHGQLWTPIVRSSEVVIEVRLPADVSAEDLSLELGQISYGYRGFGTDPVVLGAPRSGACNVDVVCSQGNPWANEIPSVGVYTLSGSWTCSGAMINNTAQNQTPYFLTADHCGISSGNAGSMVVYWNFENSTCRTPGSGASGGAGDGSLSQFTSGATFRADSSSSDFTLVQMNSAPAGAWGVTFSGWDRSTGNGSSAVAIHHPSTDEKRISFENDPVTTTSYFASSSPGNGTHIRVADWDLGTTEGGSSGSPLYNPQHQIVGQLHGGLAACGNNEADWYGRLSVSWTGGGTNATRLSNWLDPIGSGAVTLNTLVPGGSPVCGNNAVEAGETCDDGNTVSGDGCSSTCQIEASAGDECADCLAIGDGTFSGSTSDNGGAGDDTSCGGTDDLIDEWYCYTATCTGTATASTCNPGTNFDTTLAVYSSCGGTELACNDDAVGSPVACDLGGDNRKSIVTWPATSGTIYYVRVSGWGGNTGDFDLTLSCSGTNPCPNDTIANPIVIGALPFSDTGSTTGCTDNYNEVCAFLPLGAPDLVYSYTPPGDQTIAVDLCASLYDTKVYIYAGAVTSGSPLACNDDGCPGSPPASYRSSLAGVALTGGTTYFIVIDGYDAASFGTYDLTITGTAVGPINDNCANATPVGDGTTPFDSTGATTDGPDEPTACNFFAYTQVGADIWYRYTATCTGDATVSLCGSAYDTKLAVYGATCPIAASAIACNDDACGGTTRSEALVPVVVGNDYLIRIGGYEAATGAGSMTISCTSAVECVLPIDCDDSDPCTFDDCIADNCVNTIIDSDNDGEPDCTDGCPLDPFKIAPGVCGCGVPETPADGDMNADGDVDGRDIQNLVDGLVNGTTTWYDCHGDFNGSGQLDTGDVAGFVAAMLGA